RSGNLSHEKNGSCLQFPPPTSPPEGFPMFRICTAAVLAFCASFQLSVGPGGAFGSAGQDHQCPAPPPGQCAEDKKPAGPFIGHMVYFKLKDNSAENSKKLVAAC